MRASSILVALVFAVAASVTALALLLPGRTPVKVPVARLAVVPGPSLPPGKLERAAASDGRQVLSDRISAPLAEVQVAGKDAYGFDVTFLTVDELGRPVGQVVVDMALDGHRANTMTTTAWNGEAQMKWTGSMPAVNALVRCRDDGRATMFARVWMRSGSPVVVRLHRGGSSGDNPPALSMFGADGEKVDEWLNGSFTPGLRSFQLPKFRLIGERGTFLDPDMLARVRVDIDGSMGWGTTSISCGHWRAKPQVKIEGLARDEAGMPLAGIKYRVLVHDGVSWEGCTNAEGQFLVSNDEKHVVDIVIGGHDRAIIRRTFDLQTSVEPWYVTLPHVPTGTAQLTDKQGNPLAGWHIVAREADDTRTFVTSAISDERGSFLVGLPGGRTVELLARPDFDSPACVLARSFGPDTEGSARTFAVDARRGSASWNIELPAEVEGCIPEARLIRHDSQEGMVIRPFELDVVSPASRRFRFRTPSVLSGDYTLEIFAPGCSPGGSPRLRLTGVEQDLGTFTMSPGSRLSFPGKGTTNATSGSVSMSSEAQGLLIVSEPYTMPVQLVVPDGRYDMHIGSVVFEGQDSHDVNDTRSVRVARGRLLDVAGAQ